jgi:hypothetical protein
MLAVTCAAQPLGRFCDGYTATDHGVSIKIQVVHTSPRMKVTGTSKWAISWRPKRQSETVEIGVTLAGFDVPVQVVMVPGKKSAPLDQHNPVFEVPLAEVRQIDFTFRNGVKEVGVSSFK